jgi:two-component system sensor histidine kinase YesM
VKKTFFQARFKQVLTLILLPLLVFATLSSAIIYKRVKQEAESKSLMVTELIEQNMETLSGDLDYYRVSIDYDSDMNIALIKALLNSQMTYNDQDTLRKAMNYLNSSANSKAYIHSIYVTMKDSGYLITQGSRIKIQDFADKDWKTDIEDKSIPSWFAVRNIKSHFLNESGSPVVTVYQNMKYKEVLIINIKQAYFNQWLDSAADYKGQVLMILDSQNQPLFYNKNYEALSEDTREMLINDSLFSERTVNGYYCNTGEINRFGLKSVSLIPEKEILKLPKEILKVAVIAMIFCVILASILAVIMTSRDYEQIQQIIDVLEQAEKGELIQKNSNKRNAPYYFIINNIIRLFVSQSYLKVQLEARKYGLMAAQLSALQYQLNPHFLFNTLQAIDLEIMKAAKGPTAANAMMNHLSQLLRYSLENPMNKVTIEREIEMTKHYIVLQKQKKGEKFQVTWEYEEEITQYKILRLLLQPFIENALIHGIREEEKLWIKVKIYKRGPYISINVIDNGNGIKKEKLREINQRIEEAKKLQYQDQDGDYGIGGEGLHIGLENIAKRVLIGCQDSSFLVKSKEGMGTSIEIRFQDEQSGMMLTN